MTPPQAQPYIIIGGRQVALDDGVLCVCCVGITPFTFPRAKPRDPAIPIDMIVWHDTAGEGTGIKIHDVLVNKGLSIHFSNPRDGIIYQYLDPTKYIAGHAGKGNNSRSIGIETANAVFPPPPPGMKPGAWMALFSNFKRYTVTGRERLYGRPVVADGYRGGKRQVLGHFPEQIRAAKSLTKALLREFPDVPRIMPMKDGKLHGNLEVGFKGVCGHLHLTDAHVDPAMDILYPLVQTVQEAA